MKCDSYDFLVPILPNTKCAVQLLKISSIPLLWISVFVSKARQLPLHTAEQTVI